MTLPEFTAFLEQRLRLDREPFDLPDVQEYATDVWPAVAADEAPDLDDRAAECRKRCRVLAAFREATAEGRGVYVHLYPRDGAS
jgi:hypothetical protein